MQFPAYFVKVNGYKYFVSQPPPEQNSDDDIRFADISRFCDQRPSRSLSRTASGRFTAENIPANPATSLSFDSLNFSQINS